MDPGPFFYIQSANYLLLCVYFVQTITSFHSIRLILCFQQNRWDWQPHRKLGTKFCGCVVQVSTLLLAPVVRPAKAQLVTPLGCFLAPTGSIKPWFHNWGKLSAVLIIPSSWGSQRALHQQRAIKHFSGTVAGESRTSSQGESLITNLFTWLFLFSLLLFCLLVSYSKTQKN